MIIIGVGFHPEFQQIASVDTDGGEFQEERLAHREEAEKFYRALAGQKVRVGMEASGQARWFERLQEALQFEYSSGNRQRLGHITKQGSSMLRFLLAKASQVTARSVPEWRSKYFHLMMRRGRKIAKVAMARRLAIALYWMWRREWDYERVKKFGSHAGQLGTLTEEMRGSDRVS
jgi:transposase